VGAETIVLLLVAGGVLIYLAWALLNPERL